MKDLPNISIRICEMKDIALLDKHILSDDCPGVHLERLKRQESGDSTYLIAWVGDSPVGHLDLRWRGCKDPTVHQFTKGCPEFSALGVVEEFRSKGIGTRLVKHGEVMAKELGYNQIGLGVDIDNQRAKKLYERLGYVDWGQGVYEDVWFKKTKHGEEEVREMAVFMVKDLSKDGE